MYINQKVLKRESRGNHYETEYLLGGCETYSKSVILSVPSDCQDSLVFGLVSRVVFISLFLLKSFFRFASRDVASKSGEPVDRVGVSILDGLPAGDSFT